MSLRDVFRNMVTRCCDPNHKSFKDYGGRGITICEEWQKLSQFRIWALANGYKQGLEINRIDNDGNYEPSNCNFITHRENSCNKRTNVFITINGQTKIAKDWAIELGIDYPVMMNRIYAGWSPEDAVLRPIHKFKGIRFDKSRNRWRAYSKDSKYLGIFKTYEEAERVVQEWQMNQSNSV